MSEMKRPLKVFLYHTSSDRDAARELYLHLIRDGVDARLAKDKLLPGQDWKDVLQQAVREADVVIVCLSAQFDPGGSRQKEVQAAFETVVEQLDGEVLVILARLDESDRLASLEKWPWVNLFEDQGYENLLHVLQVRAEGIGASLQPKEGSLPEASIPGAVPEQPAQAAPGIVIEGSGVLIDGPAVELGRPASRRRAGRILLAVLAGAIGILALAVNRSPRLERWYQLSLTILSGKVSGSAGETLAEPVVKPPPARIVFLIDTGSSMQGQRIGIVKSALSGFTSLLDSGDLVSIFTFDTHVELQVDLTRDRTVVREVLSSAAVDLTSKTSCIYDALYAGIQETSLVPIPKGMKNIVVLLTDISPAEEMGAASCAYSIEEVRGLREKHPVSIFVVKVGEWNNLDVLKQVTGNNGEILFSPDQKPELDHALLVLADQADLSLSTEVKSPSSDEAESAKREPMVLVPAGEFVMGGSQVSLDAFWIDKTEVTNEMYRRCVQVGKCDEPHSIASSTRSTYYGTRVFVDYPVIFVSWQDASKYCAWTGGRLPSEAQWEKAARGTDGRPFPWGDQDPTGIGGFLNYQAQDTDPVGTHPNDVSPYGALDMAGNVSEWVADWFSIDYYNHPPASNPTGPEAGQYRVWRGGSWAHTSTEWIRTYSRTGNLPSDYGAGLGFRCARDAGQ